MFSCWNSKSTRINLQKLPILGLQARVVPSRFYKAEITFLWCILKKFEQKIFVHYGAISDRICQRILADNKILGFGFVYMCHIVKNQAGLCEETPAPAHYVKMAHIACH